MDNTPGLAAAMEASYQRDRTKKAEARLDEIESRLQEVEGALVAAMKRIQALGRDSFYGNRS